MDLSSKDQRRSRADAAGFTHVYRQRHAMACSGGSHGLRRREFASGLSDFGSSVERGTAHQVCIRLRTSLTPSAASNECAAPDDREITDRDALTLLPAIKTRYRSRSIGEKSV